MAAPTCWKDLPEGHFLSLSLMYDQMASSVTESSPKGNSSELSDETCGRKSGVSRPRVLIG